MYAAAAVTAAVCMCNEKSCYRIVREQERQRIE